MKKKHFAATVIASLAASQSALGADMAVKAPPAAPLTAPMAFTWTGFYVGGNIGWKEGNFNSTVSTPAYSSPLLSILTIPADSYYLGTTTANSFIGGGQFGYRFEASNSWVLGVEGNFDAQNLRSNVVQTGPGTASNTVTLNNGITLTSAATRDGRFGTLLPGDYYSEQAQWQASILGEVGYAFDRLLVYASSGVAFTRVSITGNFPGNVNFERFSYPGSSGSDSHTLTGFTIGGGVAYALDNHWGVEAQYQYTNYQGTNFSTGAIAGSCSAAMICTFVPTNTHLGLTTNELLGKVNYRF